jgi:hypothetical protein
MRLARTAAPLPRVAVFVQPGLAGRSRTCDLRRPKPVGWPAPLRPGERLRSCERLRRCAVPPAGLEPAASGLRARRHLLFDHEGAKTPAAGLEPALSRVTTARLSISTTPERKERESNPQGLKAHPFSRRDTAPLAVLPKGGPGRRRTCTDPGKNRELCRLSYGAAANVTGRGRTCDASRFGRALYRLSYGHAKVGGAGFEPAASSVSERRSAV